MILPLLGAGLTLILSRRRGLQRAVSTTVLVAVVVIAAILVYQADRHGPQVLWIGAWPEPLGISLVADRLSSLMLLVSAVVTLAVLVYSIGQGMTGDERGHPADDLPPDVPGAHRRRLERVPGRRPVQPVRQLRDAAVRELRAAHPRRHRRPDPRRHDLRRRQRAVLDAVPDLDRRDLRRHRQPQPRAAGGPDRRPARLGQPGAAAAAAHHVLDQGGGVPAVVLAARQLPDRAGTGHRRVRRPAHQGRRLRDHPHPDPAVPRQPADRTCCCGPRCSRCWSASSARSPSPTSSGCCRSPWSATSAT